MRTRVLVFFLAVTASLLGVGYLANGTAEAAVCTSIGNVQNVFPRDQTATRENFGCGGADSYIWMSTYHTGSPVNTPAANIRIFYNINEINAQPWTFDHVNFETIPPVGGVVPGNHRGGSNVEIVLVQTGATQNMYRPVGQNPVMPPGFDIDKGMLRSDPGRYGNNIRYVDIRMTQLTAQSNAPIRLRSTFWGSRITFEEQSLGAAQNPGDFSTGAFSVWSNDMGGGSQEPITYTFNFSPDCSVAQNATTQIYLKWYDADGPTSTTQPYTFTMYLVDDTTGAHLTPPGGLNSSPGNPFGGDNVNGWSGPYTVTGGHKYRWIWSNIARNNGIQIFMPFSEINNDPAAGCGNAPQGQIWASCDIFGTLYITVNVFDPDGGNLFVNLSIPTVGGAGSNGGNGNRSFGPYPGRPQDNITKTITGTVTDGQFTSNLSAGSFNCPVPFNDAQCWFASIANTGGTYPNNRYRITIQMRNTGTTTWIPGQWSLATAQGQTNNYLTNGGGAIAASWATGNVGPGGIGVFTYETTVPPGGSTNAYYWRMVQWGREWFGQNCGLNVTAPQGRVGDAFDWNVARSARIETCSMGQVNTGAGGWFTFAIPQGWAYCVRVVGGTAQGSPDNIWVWPWDEPYQSCAAHTSGGPNSYCTVYGSYECQVAGATANPACGVFNLDRARDYGYDIALAWRPDIRCTILTTTWPAGSSFSPQVSVQSVNRPGTSVAIGGTVQHSLAGQNSSGAINPAIPSPGSRTITLAPQVNIGSPGQITATAQTNWSGGPYSGTAFCPSATDRIVNLPYFKVYNGDVRVGGGFNSGETQCTTPSGVGRVAAWSTGTSPNYRGASSEFALMALGAVSGGGFGGFYSAQTNTTATPQYKPLTFGNDTSTGTYGGNLGGQHCIRDYFTTTKEGTVPEISGGTMSWASIYAQRNPTTNQIQINGNVTITGPPLIISPGQKLTVYVNNGNILVNTDMMLATNTYTSQAQIPFFALVVRGGNIMIGPNVTQLDGIYIAQPTVANTGGVYTCATGLTAVCPASTLYTQGNRKLYFFGSVVAKTLKLLRTPGHLLAVGATPGEAQSSANIAEVFIGMPELYIANPAFAPDVSETRLYDSATSLPPLL